MDPLTIIGVVNTALTVIKGLMALGQDVEPLVADVINITSKGSSVTQEDLDALTAKADEWSAQLQAPLPGEQP